MTEQRWEPGDVVRLSTQIKNIDGEAEDPTTLTFTMNAPNAEPVAYVWGTDDNNDELVRDSAGVFHVDWAIESAMTHWYSWLSEGTNAAYSEDSFVVERRRVTAPS